MESSISVFKDNIVALIEQSEPTNGI
jgi:hypothetical protein